MVMDFVTHTQWRYPTKELINIYAHSKLSSFCYATLGSVLLLKFYKTIRKDYLKFLALGPGGTPKTPLGYLRVCYLRLFTLNDPFQPPSLSQACYPQKGYIHSLPQRSVSRPQSDGIAPHRQTNQKCSHGMDQALRKELHKLADDHPALVRKGNSCFEKHGLALFLNASAASPHTEHSHLNPTCADSGEFCHLHATDSSMHLTLHPLDAAMVIGSGWGERHPLAGRNIHGERLLPHGFLMIYTPQKEEEIATLMTIVKAAGWWVGGVDLGSQQAPEKLMDGGAPWKKTVGETKRMKSESHD